MALLPCIQKRVCPPVMTAPTGAVFLWPDIKKSHPEEPLYHELCQEKQAKPLLSVNLLLMGPALALPIVRWLPVKHLRASILIPLPAETRWNGRCKASRTARRSSAAVRMPNGRSVSTILWTYASGCLLFKDRWLLNIPLRQTTG